MARNTIVVYKESTDLRGKRVELRSERIVDIPKDAIRTEKSSFISYRHDGPTMFQNTTKGACLTHSDIMKVVK